MYPQLFCSVEIYPRIYYIFVTRGRFMNVPDKNRGRQRFETTCPAVISVTQRNVMVLSCCSGYMCSMRLDNASRCSFTCNVPEALINVWSLSSGSGGPRFPRSLAALDDLAKDQCQSSHVC